MEHDFSYIGQAIKEAREERGLSQRQLAMLLDTTQIRIAQMESPGYNKHTMKTLCLVAEALNIPLDVKLVPKGQAPAQAHEGVPECYLNSGVWKWSGKRINA